MKKELLEDFSWMGQAAAEYEDCREALNRVEGAKEYLKNYVAVEEGTGFNFDDPIGNQIKLGDHHSGASYYSMLWVYKRLLNDWDGWVLAQKERVAYEEYQKVQVRPDIITHLYYTCTEFLNGNTGGAALESELLAKAATVGLEGSIQDVYNVVAPLFAEHVARMELQSLQRKRRAHVDLIGGLKWKYKHPSRWFDTPWGSTIAPTTPQYITPDAFAEMEQLYPGYKEHIQHVERALSFFQLPAGITRYSPEGNKFTEDVMRRFQVIV